VTRKKVKPPEDWRSGWLAASFMSTATRVGALPRPLAPGEDDEVEAEISACIKQTLHSFDINVEITAAIISPQAPSNRWRYVGVLKTERGPATCMLQSNSPDALITQAVAWTNHFKQKWDRATRMLEKLDELAFLGHTVRSHKKKTKDGSNG
jgi:hypothetical protein